MGKRKSQRSIAMTKQKSDNKWPLFNFAGGLLMTTYGISQIDNIKNIDEHILAMFFIGLLGTWSIINLIILIKNDFFIFLKRKRFWFFVLPTVAIFGGIAIYISISQKNIKMELIFIYVTFVVLLLWTINIWKILEEVGVDDGL